MRTLTLVALSFAFGAAACSSSDSGSTQKPPTQSPASYDSNGDNGGTAVPNPVRTITISIQGSGNVFTRDGTVSCTSDGATISGDCNAEHGVVLYAQPTEGWHFVSWNPPGQTSPELQLTLLEGGTVNVEFDKN